VPGLGGQALSFVALARAVAEAYALHCFHLEPSPDAQGDDPDLVQRYLSAMRASGPGPYRLAGYCAGAYVACAIASRLRADERAGRVLAIVRTGAEADALRAVRDLPAVAGLVDRLRLRRDGGESSLFDAADLTALGALGLSEDVAPQHALRIAEVIADQAASLALEDGTRFPTPVRLIVGAPDRGSALAIQEHWTSILRDPPSADLVVGPQSDAWLKRPGVAALARIILEELR
jgi:thioesterase domain-containing protein